MVVVLSRLVFPSNLINQLQSVVVSSALGKRLRMKPGEGGAEPIEPRRHQLTQAQDWQAIGLALDVGDRAESKVNRLWK